MTDNNKPIISITWFGTTFGVVIETDNERFAIQAGYPSYRCTWDDAMRLYRSNGWSLPTVNQLLIVSQYKDAINALIKEYEGYEIKGWLWSNEEADEKYAFGVSMTKDYFEFGRKDKSHNVRAVYNM